MGWLKLVGSMTGLGVGVALTWFFFVAIVLPAQSPRERESEDRSVLVQGVRGIYRSFGHGPESIILLHGFGGSLRQWEAVWPRLPCAEVYALDLLGFGASERPKIRYDLESHRRYLLGFMDAVGLRQVVLVGTSFGGSVAAWAAAHTPQRVRAAVLIAPSGFPGSLKYAWPKSMFYRPGLANEAAWDVVQHPAYPKLFPHSLAAQAIGATASYDERFAKALFKVRQPTLLMWDPEDSTVPERYRSEYLRRIPHARALSLDTKAGHALVSAASKEVAFQLCAFVTQLPP